jgi:phosphatidylserine/phosphatidylglycerophosphate/cardiolipin synthase-like enzyme
MYQHTAGVGGGQAAANIGWPTGKLNEFHSTAAKDAFGNRSNTDQTRMMRFGRVVVKQRNISFGLLCLSTLFGYTSPARADPPGKPPAIEVYFSPKGGCTEAVVRELRNAKQTVLVQAYSFTSAPIAKALVDAHKRGVKVQVILDKSQRTDKYSSATFLHNAGIPTSIDAAHAIAHDKVMVIDGAVVITGSFNFTKAASERNGENLLIIRDRQLAVKYAANWEAHFEHSERYEVPFRRFGLLWAIQDHWQLILAVLAFLALLVWRRAAQRRGRAKWQIDRNR